MSATLPKAPAAYDQAQMQKILQQIEKLLGSCIKTTDTITIGVNGNQLQFKSPDGNLHVETVDNTGTPHFT